MKKSMGAKTILYPTPVLVVGTYDADGNGQRHDRRMGRRRVLEAAVRVGVASRRHRVPRQHHGPQGLHHQPAG